jgi:hypothetical protein
MTSMAKRALPRASCRTLLATALMGFTSALALAIPGLTSASPQVALDFATFKGTTVGNVTSFLGK